MSIGGSQAQMVDRVAELATMGLTGFYGYVADERALDALASTLPALRAAIH